MLPLFQKMTKWPWVTWSWNQYNRMSISLGWSCLTVFFVMPLTVVLLEVMGVRGCGWPIPMRSVQRLVASLAMWNRAPTSASVAEDTTLLRMVEMVWTAPFFLVGGGGGGCIVEIWGLALVCGRAGE